MDAKLTLYKFKRAKAGDPGHEKDVIKVFAAQVELLGALMNAN